MDIKIIKGSTYRDTLRWATSDIIFKPITGISNGAPCIVTAIGHGLVDGWMVTIESVKVPKDLNGNQYRVKVLTADTFELVGLNSLDMKPYSIESGAIKYNAPVDLTGYKARMQIRQSYTDPVLLEMTTENDLIVVDNTAKTIQRIIPACDTKDIDWTAGIFDLEMYIGETCETEFVVKIDKGKVSITEEVTKPVPPPGP